MGCGPEESSRPSERPDERQRLRQEVPQPAVSPDRPRIRQTATVDRRGPVEPESFDTVSSVIRVRESNPPAAVKPSKPERAKEAQALSTEAPGEPVKTDRITLEVLKELQRAWGCEESAAAPPVARN